MSSGLLTMAFFGIVMVLENLFLLRLGLDTRFIGAMHAFGQIVWAAAALPAGALGNRIGGRNSILLGQGLAGLGLAVLLLVEGRPEATWRAWLLGSQAVIMSGVALITVNTAPYVMAVTKQRERHYAFASLPMITLATAFLGSLIAGRLPGLFAGWLKLGLDQAAPYRLALWTGPVLVVFAILSLLGADPAELAPRDRQRAVSGPAPIRWLLFLGLLVWFQGIAEGSIRAFFNVYLDTALSAPTARIGTIMAVAQLFAIGAALAAPLLIARFGAGHALAAALLGAGLCQLPLTARPQLAAAGLAFMGFTAMATMALVSRNLFSQEMVRARWRTTSQGVVIVGGALGWATAGMGGGYLIETIGFRAMFLAAAASVLVSAGLLAGFLRRRSPGLPGPQRGAAG